MKARYYEVSKRPCYLYVVGALLNTDHPVINFFEPLNGQGKIAAVNRVSQPKLKPKPQLPFFAVNFFTVYSNEQRKQNITTFFFLLFLDIVEYIVCRKAIFSYGLPLVGFWF